MMSGDDSTLVMESRGAGDDPKTPDFPKNQRHHMMSSLSEQDQQDTLQEFIVQEQDMTH